MKLNISSIDQKILLAAVNVTTHPSVFSRLVASVKADIENNKLATFTDFAMSNANLERRMAALGVGSLLVAGGVLSLTLITLSSASPGLRWLPLLAFVPGIATLSLALCGKCILLHARQRYQLPPWEGYPIEDAEDAGAAPEAQKLWEYRYTKTTWLERVLAKEGKILDRGIASAHQSQLLAAVGFSVFVSFHATILVFFLANTERINYLN